jgi:hypothetical protein
VKTIAEVLAEQCDHITTDEYGDVLAFTGSADDLADALTAAGFGPVKAAQEAAWDEGYDRAESDHDGTGFWTKRLRGNPYRVEAVEESA